MIVNNHLILQAFYKFFVLTFISCSATFWNAQESFALPLKKVLNEIGHDLVDELLTDKSSPQVKQYSQESINQKIADATNTYTPNYQSPPPNYQSPPPNYQSPPPNYQSPPPNYQSPPPNYQSPPPNYQSPPPNYQSPPPNYQSPPPNYQSSPTNYQSPPPNYQSSPTNYQSPPPNYQSPPPNYQYPASISSPNLFPYSNLQMPNSSPPVIINNFVTP